MFKRGSLVWVALLGVMALLASGMIVGCGGSADGPEGTVEAFWKAVSDGDGPGMAALVTGEALKKMPKPDSPKFKQMAPMGKAFMGVVESKVDGDTALVTMKIDAEVFLAGIMNAVLDKIKDPEMKKKMAAQMKASMAKEIKKMERAQVKMVKKDGKWLISDFVEQ